LEEYREKVTFIEGGREFMYKFVLELLKLSSFNVGKMIYMVNCFVLVTVGMKTSKIQL
jgi:hypothetical protein